MTAQLSSQPVFQAFAPNGGFLVGGQLFTYIAGTTTPQATYIDSTQITPNTNPVILNSLGQCNLWLVPSQTYKLVLQDATGHPIWSVDNVPGGPFALPVSTNILPAITNTYNIGSPSFTWANLYLGPNGASVLDPISGNIGYYARTAAETAAVVTPTNFAYAPLNILRYGGDNTGTTDNTVAFQTLLKVILQLGGASCVIPPGKYNINTSIVTTLTPNTGPNNEAFGLTLYAYGVIINYTGATGYAFDFLSPNTVATFYSPLVTFYGMNVLGNATAPGAFRINDISAARFYDCRGQGFTTGAAFTLRNTSSWCENDHFIGCSAVNCQTGIAFVNTLVPPAGVSFARTTVLNFFGAGITNFWFDIGGGCAVYDSRFSHICGNFGSIAFFAIGAAGAGASMQATVIDGIDAEWGSTPGQQGIIRLRDYPQGSGAPRPIVYNIGANALFTGGGPVPIWTRETGAAIAGPESAALQQFPVETGLLVRYGVSQIYENLASVAALRAVATQNSALNTVTMTGFAAVSGRMTMNRNGNEVTLIAFDPLTGTSNATTMGLTGITAEYQPSAARIVTCMVQNNGVQVQAQASISAAGVITFSMQTALNIFSATGFTNAAANGLTAGTTIIYSL